MIKKWWEGYKYRREYPGVNEYGVRYKIMPDGELIIDKKSLMNSPQMKRYLEASSRLPLNVPLDDLNRPMTEVDDDEYLRRTGIIE